MNSSIELSDERLAEMESLGSGRVSGEKAQGKDMGDSDAAHHVWRVNFLSPDHNMARLKELLKRTAKCGFSQALHQLTTT